MRSSPKAKGIRGCCWGAGRLLESLGIDSEGGWAIEPTFDAHRREVETKRSEFDPVMLAAIHLDRISAQPEARPLEQMELTHA